MGLRFRTGAASLAVFGILWVLVALRQGSTVADGGPSSSFFSPVSSSVSSSTTQSSASSTHDGTLASLIPRERNEPSMWQAASSADKRCLGLEETHSALLLLPTDIQHVLPVIEAYASEPSVRRVAFFDPKAGLAPLFAMRGTSHHLEKVAVIDSTHTQALDGFLQYNEHCCRRKPGCSPPQQLFVVGDTVVSPFRWIEEEYVAGSYAMDLLFSDSLHNGDHLFMELMRMAPHTSSYILIHDSLHNRRLDAKPDARTHGFPANATRPVGVQDAVALFLQQKAGSEWAEDANFPLSNGLLVLRRGKPSSSAAGCSHHQIVDPFAGRTSLEVAALLAKTMSDDGVETVLKRCFDSLGKVLGGPPSPHGYVACYAAAREGPTNNLLQRLQDAMLVHMSQHSLAMYPVVPLVRGHLLNAPQSGVVLCYGCTTSLLVTFAHAHLWRKFEPLALPFPDKDKEIASVLRAGWVRTMSAPSSLSDLRNVAVAMAVIQGSHHQPSELARLLHSVGSRVLLIGCGPTIEKAVVDAGFAVVSRVSAGCVSVLDRVGDVSLRYVKPPAPSLAEGETKVKDLGIAAGGAFNAGGTSVPEVKCIKSGRRQIIVMLRNAVIWRGGGREKKDLFAMFLDKNTDIAAARTAVSACRKDIAVLPFDETIVQRAVEVRDKVLFVYERMYYWSHWHVMFAPHGLFQLNIEFNAIEQDLRLGDASGLWGGGGGSAAAAAAGGLDGTTPRSSIRAALSHDGQFLGGNSSLARAYYDVVVGQQPQLIPEGTPFKAEWVATGVTDCTLHSAYIMYNIPPHCVAAAAQLSERVVQGMVARHGDAPFSETTPVLVDERKLCVDDMLRIRGLRPGLLENILVQIKDVGGVRRVSMDALSAQEQFHALRSSKVIVVAEGAALANIIVNRPGTTWIVVYDHWRPKTWMHSEFHAPLARVLKTVRLIFFNIYYHSVPSMEELSREFQKPWAPGAVFVGADEHGRQPRELEAKDAKDAARTAWAKQEALNLANNELCQKKKKKPPPRK